MILKQYGECLIGNYESFSENRDSHFRIGKSFKQIEFFPLNTDSIHVIKYKMDVFGPGGKLYFSSQNPNQVWIESNKCPDSVQEGNYYYVQIKKHTGDTIESRYTNVITVLKPK